MRFRLQVQTPSGAIAEHLLEEPSQDAAEAKVQQVANARGEKVLALVKLPDGLRDGACPQCGSRRVLGNLAVPVGAGDGHLKAVIYLPPAAGIFARRSDCELRAWMCSACGFTEFFGMSPQSLWETEQQGDRVG